VYLYDGEGRMLTSKKAKIYRGARNIVGACGGTHLYEIRSNEDDFLVINPKNLSHLSPAHGWQWYVKECMMKELGYTIFTDWTPTFLDSRKCAELSMSDGIPEALAVCKFPVVPSINTDLYRMYRDDVPMIPLLETLIHVKQEFSGMTLCQIACSIEGEFKDLFNDETKLMKFLFREHVNLLKELCVEENTPLSELYQCNFNIIFDHNQRNYVDNNHIRVLKNMKNVVMKPLSKIVSSDGSTYGNIPWLIASVAKKDEILKKAKFILHPFGFFDETYDNEDIYFNNVCILPEIAVDIEKKSEDGSVEIVKHVYPSGAMIGITTDEDGRTDTVMRGALFEDTTTREQMILILMFNAYAENSLDEDVDCTRLLRNLKLNEDQLHVRPHLINAIQAKLLA
jgi:hypothetical protein